MGFRNLLNDLPEEKVETVTDGDETYTFSGTQNAEIMLSPYSIRADEKAVLCKQWKSVIKTRFKRNVIVPEALVWKVRVVAATLQAPEGEKPPEEIEIAVIACCRGALFTRMFLAAMSVLGSVGNELLPDLAEQAAEGNSDGVTETTPVTP